MTQYGIHGERTKLNDKAAALDNAILTTFAELLT